MATLLRNSQSEYAVNTVEIIEHDELLITRVKSGFEKRNQFTLW